MKFIPIMEISSQIMTLIEDTDNELVIVSPYISIRKWVKMKNCLRRAAARGVKITVYARKNAEQDLSDLAEFNVRLILVKDLHAKIYLNENYGIVSSQNMIEYSDENSIDFAYNTESEAERLQLQKLIKQYLQIHDQQQLNRTADNQTSNVVQDKIKTLEKIPLLDAEQLECIHEQFSRKFRSNRISFNTTYVFCTNIFDFGDVMFREGYEIRFNSQLYKYEGLIFYLENLNLNFLNHQYIANVKIQNGNSSSIMFVPQDFKNFKNLLEDYLNITELIYQNVNYVNA